MVNLSEYYTMMNILKLPTHMDGFLHPLGENLARMAADNHVMFKKIHIQGTVGCTAMSVNQKQSLIIISKVGR